MHVCNVHLLIWSDLLECSDVQDVPLLFIFQLLQVLHFHLNHVLWKVMYGDIQYGIAFCTR